MDRLIRPDVRLYVGQSGSALVNEQGQVLGINSAALARNAVITVPAATIDRVVDAILERGHVPRPFSALPCSRSRAGSTARTFRRRSRRGLAGAAREPNAPAASGGILVGDLLLSVDGHAVHNVHAVQHRLSSLKVGDTVVIGVVRGGVRMELKVILADRG